MGNPLQEKKLSHYNKVIREINEPTVLIQMPLGRIISTNHPFNRFFKQDRITTTGKTLDNVLGTQIVPRLDLKNSGNFTICYAPRGSRLEEHHLIVSCVWIEKGKYCLITFFDFGKSAYLKPRLEPFFNPLQKVETPTTATKFDKKSFDQAEDFLQVQYEILDALQHMSNTEGSLNDILRTICRIKGVQTCAIYMYNDLQKFQLSSFCLGDQQDMEYPKMIHKDFLPDEFFTTEAKSRYYQLDKPGIPVSHMIPMRTDQRLLGILVFLVDIRKIETFSMDTLLVFSNWISSFLDRETSRRQLFETMQNYRTLMENIHEGLVIIDREERFTLVNRALCELTGYSEEDYLGSKIWDFFEPTQSKKVKRMRSERPKKGDKKYEITIQKKNGERIWLTISPTTLHDAFGNPNGVMAIVTDITHYLKILENYSVEQGNIVDVLKNVTNLSIFSFNVLENKLEFTNEHSVNHYGFTYEELNAFTNESMIEMVHPEDRSLIRNFFFDAETSKRNLFSTTIAYRILTKFDDYRWVSSSLIAQKNNRGKIERILCCSVDINDYRINSERLDEQYSFNRILFRNNPLPMLIVQDSVTGNKLKQNKYESNVDPDELLESNLGAIQNRTQKMHILDTNDACLRLFELEHPQEMVSTFHNYITIEMVEGIRKSLIAYMTGSMTRWFPGTGLTKSGKLLQLEIFINPAEFHEDSLIIAFKEL